MPNPTPKSKCCNAEIWWNSATNYAGKCSKCRELCQATTTLASEEEKCIKCGHNKEQHYKSTSAMTSGILICRGCSCAGYTSPASRPTEVWLVDYMIFMKERHEQLKGYYDNPFLEKPIALPDNCPKCHVNVKSLFDDSIKFFAAELAKKDVDEKDTMDTGRLMEKIEGKEYNKGWDKGYASGLKENFIRMDEWFAKEVMDGANEATKEMRKVIETAALATYRKELVEDIKKIPGLWDHEIRGGEKMIEEKDVLSLLQ